MVGTLVRDRVGEFVEEVAVSSVDLDIVKPSLQAAVVALAPSCEESSRHTAPSHRAKPASAKRYTLHSLPSVPGIVQKRNLSPKEPSRSQAILRLSPQRPILLAILLLPQVVEPKGRGWTLSDQHERVESRSCPCERGRSRRFA